MPVLPPEDATELAESHSLVDLPVLPADRQWNTSDLYTAGALSIELADDLDCTE